MSCCCESRGGHHRRGRHHGHGHGHSSCGCGSRFRRKFTNKAEKIKKLENYIEDLEAEIAGVKEAIAEMKAE